MTSRIQTSSKNDLSNGAYKYWMQTKDGTRCCGGFHRSTKAARKCGANMTSATLWLKNDLGARRIEA